MSTDYILVTGVVFLGIAAWSYLSTFTHGGRARGAVVMAAVAVGMIAYASSKMPHGFSASDVPAAFGRVISDLTS